MKYNQLRTLSFRLNERKPPEPQIFKTLSLPETWKNELRNLQAEITGRSVDKTNVPIANLNKALRALVPDLIYIEPYAAKSGERAPKRWLYATEAIDTQALYLIVNAWVHTQFSKASDARRSQLLAQLKVGDLQWAATPVTGTWSHETNGTAKLDISNFILLPHVLAAQLSQENASIEFGPETLRFRRASLGAGTLGAELVSWPPIKYDDEWYWSVVVTFTLQTIPFQSFPVLHCDLSLRRWCSQPTYLPGGKETSVYLLTNVPWLKNLPSSNSFQVASIEWEAVPASERNENASDEYRLVWGSKLPALLDRLNLLHKFPTPQNIKDDPVSALNLSGSPNAGLVFRYGIKPQHGVGPGLMPGNRRTLAEEIAELIAPQWELVEPLPRVTFRPKVATNPFFPNSTAKKKRTESKFQEQRVRAIAETVGDSLTVEIWYQRETMRDESIKAIRDWLGIPESASFPYNFPEGDFTLDVRAQLLGALGDKLEIDSGIKNEKTRRRQAISQRGEEVAEKVEALSGVTAALVELAGADGFSSASEDPKQALRRGFALCYRVTQFITTEEKSLSHRAKSGFLDLLRQLGVQGAPPKIAIAKHKLPDPLHYVGLWLMKHNSPTSADGSVQRVPVMVYMKSDSTEIQAIAPGFDSWLSYREALLKIAKGEVKGVGRVEQTIPFIKEKLTNDVLPLGDTLLVCHAQNLRSAWKWLTNGNIAIDTVAFGNEPQRSIGELKGLRIVRVRDSQRHETPEWYAQEEDKKGLIKDRRGFSDGLFQMGDRVFASTYNKPKQLKNLSVNTSKVSSWTNSKGTTKDPSPGAFSWNPGLFELTVACIQPGDEIFPWAAITHELRHIALQYDEALKLPLPLHLAKQMEEYVLLIENEEIK
ncbi:MAG: DUF3962 domain-containing protein [Cyanobacteriota bacterium]|nr:DUF3962 domain-containing protein [Cyanobacteriota bacterium]